MIIKSIELFNYRIFAGRNKIVFPEKEGDKNLYLIPGKNGFGKTTFLHSLMWCLYGRNTIEVDDDFRKEVLSTGYSKQLEQNLNLSVSKKLEDPKYADIIKSVQKSGYTEQTSYLKEYSSYSVSIEFVDVLIPSIPCKSIEVKRSYDVISKKEVVDILIDGVSSELTIELGNDIFINDFILSREAARFFFFDSERIVSLAETNTVAERRQLNSAYNEVLGIKKYEDLKKNLENSRIRFRRRSQDTVSRDRLIKYLDREKQLLNRIKTNEQQTKECLFQLEELKVKDQSVQMLLLREGSTASMESVLEKEKKLEGYKINDLEYKQRLKTFLEYAPFAIAGDLFERTKEQIENDFKYTELNNNSSNINSTLDVINKEIQDQVSSIVSSKDEQNKLYDALNTLMFSYRKNSIKGDYLMNVNREEHDEFMAVFLNLRSTYKIEFEHLVDDYRKNRQNLNRINREIRSVYTKESDIATEKLREEKNSYEGRIKETDERIRHLHEERGSINNELAVVKKQVSELSKKVSLDGLDHKKDLLAQELISELDVFLTTFKKERKSSFEEKIKNTLNSLMHKSNFINKVEVEVNSDMIDIHLKAQDGSIIKKETLSKGEQQLYATSILKALVDESGIKFPVLIDSPLQKLDKKHASKIITEFYPSISKQVVLFPLLNKELTEEEYKIMKPYVNASYLIDNHNSNSFITEVNIDNLMDN